MSISIGEYKKKYARQIEEYKISVVSRVCSDCVHFDALNPIARLCAAFPDGIPLPIWKGENDHTKSYPGDGGIRYEPVEFKRAA